MSEQIYLHSAGSIPGFPGTHGPGLYEIDYETRTVVPVVDSTIEPVQAPAQEPLQGAVQEPDPNATQPLVEPTEPVVEGQERQ